MKIKNLFNSLLILGLIPGLFGSLSAEEITYDEVAKRFFWRDLYSQGGWSLYCGFRFDGSGKTETGGHVQIQHIVPVNTLIQSAGCKSRQQCRESNNQKFIKMEADLHNLYPVWWEIASTNHETRFGELEGENWRFNQCDYERRFGVIEPRSIAKGNIARAVLYMHSRYNIDVNRDSLILLKKWNLEDPPSKQEKNRNNIIEAIQGNRNPYVDNHKLINKIIAKKVKAKP